MNRPARGVALVLVLWLIALLTAMVGVFALNARVEAMAGGALRGGLRGQAVARAGLEYAVARLQDAPATRWRGDGRRYDWQFDGVPVQVRIVDEGGKVDLNSASPALLEALLHALGSPRPQAQRLAAEIVDWRDRDSLVSPGGAEDADYAAAGLPYGAKDAPFESLGELRLLPGMDAGLVERLRPNVTLHGQRAQPLATFAPAPVLVAMGLDPAPWLAAREAPGPAAALRSGPDPVDPAAAATGTGTYSIESRARLDGEREAVLRAIVRTGLQPSRDSAYTVLQWEEGAATQ